MSKMLKLSEWHLQFVTCTTKHYGVKITGERTMRGRWETGRSVGALFKMLLNDSQICRLVKRVLIWEQTVATLWAHFFWVWVIPSVTLAVSVPPVIEWIPPHEDAGLASVLGNYATESFFCRLWFCLFPWFSQHPLAALWTACLACVRTVGSDS